MFGIKKNLNLNLIEDEIKQNSNSTSNNQSIYQQELDENDNKYIYYKNNKEFTKKIEIFVKVSNNSKKKKIIVIDESVSMEFLHLKILESFEKSAEYQSLEGLKLESIKKENSNENLPLKGNVKDYIKNGDLLLCEINANEIWVSTKITMNNSFYNKIIFTCDIKIKKNMKVKTFKEILYKICFNIFLKKYNTLGKSKLNGFKGDKTLVHFIVSNIVFDFNEEDENKNLDELVNENSEIKIVVNFKLLENAIFNRFKRIYLDEINSDRSSVNNSMIMDINNNDVNNNNNINKNGNNIRINLSINSRNKNDERWKLFKNLTFSNLLKNNKFVNERNYIFYIAKKFCEKHEKNQEYEEKLDDEKSEADGENFLLKNIYIYNSLNNNSNRNSKENLDNDLDNDINNSNENEKKYIIILNPNDNGIEDEYDEEENEEEEEEEEEEENSEDNDALNKSNDNYINSSNNEENKNKKKLKIENRPSIESKKSDNILMNNNNNKNFDKNIFKNNYLYKKKIFNSQKTINFFYKNNNKDLIKDFEKLKTKVFIDIINEEKKIDIIKGSIEKIEIPELRNKKFSNIERDSFDLKLEKNNYNIKNVLIEFLIILIILIILMFLIYYSFKKYIY